MKSTFDHSLSARVLAISGLAILALAAAMPVSAQEIAHTQFFPILARTSGAGGTQWVSDLTVHNMVDSQVVVGVQFLEADKANVFNPSFPDRFTLAARETLAIEDVLNELFGYDTNIKGAMIVTVDNQLVPGAGNPAGSEILATTRTYNTGDPAGTFGQTVPAIGWVINAAPTKSIVTGAINSTRFRSNLGAMNMTFLDDLRIKYRVLDGAGDVVAEGMKTLHPASVSQWSFQNLGVPKQDGPLTVEMWMHPDDVLADPCATNFPTMFIGYVSKVDGNPDGTGDAEFIYAAPNDPYDCLYEP
jgi:hypothetical protein